MEYFQRIYTNNNLEDYLNNNPFLTSHIGKTLIDIEGKINFPDFRKYKDETTTQFNKSFFIDQNNNIDNIDKLNIFTFYTFQKINFNIISNINDNLFNSNEYINHNEDIILLFKGGNIMNYYINNMISTLSINPNDPTNSFRSFIKDPNGSINVSGVSDTDYSIYILTNDERKFNLIYKYVSDLLYKSLVEIRNIFEQLLNANINNIKDFFKIDNIQNLINNQNFNLVNENENIPNKNILKIEYNIIKELDIIIFDDNILQIQSEQNKFIQKFTNISNKIVNILINSQIIKRDNHYTFKFSIFKDIYNSARYIKILSCILHFFAKYIYHLKKIPESSDFCFISININNIIQQQRIISNSCLNNVLVELNEFYSRNKINTFLNSICTEFNNDNFRKNSFYEYAPGKLKYIKEYKMKYDNNNGIQILNPVINKNNRYINYNLFNLNDLDNRINPSNNYISLNIPTTYLSKKNDFILHNIPDINFTEYIQNNKNEYYHYITVNSSINYMIEGSHIVQFDLYRIKLNVLLSHIIEVDKNNSKTVNSLNIPSEFIDVSIPKFNDMVLSKFRKKIYDSNYTYNNFFAKLSFGNKKNIFMYNLSYLIEDLSIVLFSQNNFIPWADSKYNKRLKRITILSCILFIKNSSNNKDRYFKTKVYLLSLNMILKDICKNLYTYYNNNYVINPMLPIEYQTELLGINNNFNIENIKNLINNLISNNNNQHLFDKEIINNFVGNSEYFNIDYNKLNQLINLHDPPNFNLILKDYFNKLFSFLFRNIIYDIVDQNSLYKYIESTIYKYKITFNTKKDKDKFIKEKFRIENYKCLKFFSNIFEIIIMFFLFNNNIDVQNYIDQHGIYLSSGNLLHGGGVLKNNKIISVQNKNIENLLFNNKKLINHTLDNNIYKKEFNSINNKKSKNMIEIKEKSIQFNNVLIEDLDCDFKKNNNITNDITNDLYCGISDDYEPSFNLKKNNKSKKEEYIKSILKIKNIISNNKNLKINDFFKK